MSPGKQAFMSPYASGLGALGGLGAAMSGWDSSAGSEESMTLTQDRLLRAQHIFATPGWLGNVFKFFRGNKEVEIKELDLENKRYEEPLDGLRIKVAKWLQGKVKINMEERSYGRESRIKQGYANHRTNFTEYAKARNDPDRSRGQDGTAFEANAGVVSGSC